MFMSMLVEPRIRPVGLAISRPVSLLPETRVLGQESVPWLEHHVLFAKGGSRCHSCTAYKAGRDGLGNRAVEVRHDQNVELGGGLDELHAGVVNDHLLEGDGGVLLGGLARALEEQAVHHLPASASPT